MIRGAMIRYAALLLLTYDSAALCRYAFTITLPLLTLTPITPPAAFRHGRRSLMPDAASHYAIYDIAMPPLPRHSRVAAAVTPAAFDTAIFAAPRSAATRAIRRLRRRHCRRREYATPGLPMRDADAKRSALRKEAMPQARAV